MHSAAVDPLNTMTEPEMGMVHCQSGICVDLKDETEDMDRSEPVYAFFFLVIPKAHEGEHLASAVDEPV